MQLHGKKTRIRSRAEFLASYDQIFESGVRCEIFVASDADIWRNSHGFTVKDGALWFDDFSPPGINNDPNAPDFWTKGIFKVMTVNNGASYPCERYRSSHRHPGRYHLLTSGLPTIQQH